MANDISGFGTVINIIASRTFPTGLIITQSADDADPLDISPLQIASGAMGANGNFVKWSVANPFSAAIAVVPGSPDDVNLQALFEANRVGQGKVSARDDITMTIVYPDTSQVTLTSGIIMEGMPGKSVGSNSRLKTRVYRFMFENKVGG